MEEILNNAWVLTVCGGIIATVVGGLMVHFLVRGEVVELSGCAARIMFFLFIEVTIVAVLGLFYWLAADFGEINGGFSGDLGCARHLNESLWGSVRI